VRLPRFSVILCLIESPPQPGQSHTEGLFFDIENCTDYREPGRQKWRAGFFVTYARACL
jgi:hypothetical protein